MSLFVRIVPNKIPDFWDAIKFAVSRVEGIPEGKRPERFNQVLIDLMCERLHCFVRVSDQRELLAVIILRLTLNQLTGKQSLMIDTLYSFKSVDNEEWVSNMESVKKFAKRFNCEEVMAYTNVPRVQELMTLLGMKHVTSVYTLNINEV